MLVTGTNALELSFMCGLLATDVHVEQVRTTVRDVDVAMDLVSFLGQKIELCGTSSFEISMFFLVRAIVQKPNPLTQLYTSH